MATGIRLAGNPPKPSAPFISTRTDIPHGKSPDERRAYVKEIVKYSPQYYCLQGTWGLRENYSLPAGDVYLMEVWDDVQKPIIHPSRNAFHRVVEPTQKDIWLDKAQGPLTAIAVELRGGRVPPQGALTALGISRATGPIPKWVKDCNKSETIPIWATHVENLVGYTCETDITWILDTTTKNTTTKNYVSHRKNLAVTALPSVYFKQGHLTSDHDVGGNIGWRSETGACLFFGNVLESAPRQ